MFPDFSEFPLRSDRLSVFKLVYSKACRSYFTNRCDMCTYCHLPVRSYVCIKQVTDYLSNEMTITPHSHADYAFENQSRDNASEATAVDREPSSKQNIHCQSMLLTPPPPKNFTRRKRGGPVCVKSTAGAHQSNPDFIFISQARRNAFEEICAFDLLPVGTIINDDDSLLGPNLECRHCRGQNSLMHFLFRQRPSFRSLC